MFNSGAGRRKWRKADKYTEEGDTSGVIARFPGWPTLPDLFGWVESGFPGAHTVPGLHGIRVEEHLADGTYVLRAELPGIDPAKDVEITVAVEAKNEEATAEYKDGLHQMCVAGGLPRPRTPLCPRVPYTGQTSLSTGADARTVSAGRGAPVGAESGGACSPVSAS